MKLQELNENEMADINGGGIISLSLDTQNGLTGVIATGSVSSLLNSVLTGVTGTTGGFNLGNLLGGLGGGTGGLNLSNILGGLKL